MTQTVLIIDFGSQVTQLIGEGGIGSPLIKMKMPRMNALEFGDADFMLRHMVKDLGYAAKLAASLGVSPDVTTAAAGYYARAEAEHGDKDFAAVLAALRG